MSWPFDDLMPLSYGVILVDPPWRFLNYSAAGEVKNPVAHYACMDLAAIKKLPVNQLAAPDCALIMWATAPLLDIQMDVLKSWGFAFKSAGAWAKQSSTGAKWAFGTGYCFRSAAEFFLLGTVGQPKQQARDVRNLIVAPVREHSRKPNEMRALCERLWLGPRVELFARETAPGWSSWGNQVGKFDASEGVAA